MPDLDTDGGIFVYCHAVVSSYKFVVSSYKFVVSEGKR